MGHRRYLRPADAAQKIDVTVGTLANWRWKGVGPADYAIGGLIRYADDEVEGWLKAGWRPVCDNRHLNLGIDRTPQSVSSSRMGHDGGPPLLPVGSGKAGATTEINEELEELPRNEQRPGRNDISDGQKRKSRTDSGSRADSGTYQRAAQGRER
jgi:hypothetical protein